MAETLRRLAEALPLASEAAEGEDMDRRAAATLRLVIDRALKADETAASEPYEPDLCPNCGTAVASAKSPYCGERCREEAAFVRQLRAGLSEGSSFDAERLANL